MPLFNWPYTNLHSLNLDWIIKKIKNVETAETNTAASEEAAAGSSASASASAANAALSETNAAGSATAAAGSAAQAQALVDQLNTTIAEDVSNWLEENLTPTTPPVDDTLTIQRAAADAKKTGDEITDLKNDIHYSLEKKIAEWEQGTYANATGLPAQSNNYARTVEFIETESVSLINKPLAIQLYWFKYDENKNYLSRGGASYNSVWIGSGAEILAASPDAKYLRFAASINNDVTTPQDIVNSALDIESLYKVETIKSTVDALDADTKQFFKYENIDITESLSFNVSMGSEKYKNMIVKSNAMYEGTPPEIRVARRWQNIDGNWLEYYSTPNYRIGGDGTYKMQEWRVPQWFEGCADYVTVRITVPTGTTLHLKSLTNVYDDSIFRSENGIHLNAHGYSGFGGAAQTLYQYTMAAKLGYKYCITIPKVTSDGVYVCLHDDDNIQGTARNDDGSEIAAEYQNRPVSDFTYAQLLQFDFGIVRGLPFKGSRIPLLSEFFKICARTGMHPMLSVHPSLSGHWNNIKALAKKYGVLSTLNIKSDPTSIEVPMAVLGNEIESYTIDLSTNESAVSRFNSLTATYSLQNVKRVIEYNNTVITDALISDVLSNGYLCGVFNYSSTNRVLELYEKGVTEFTEDYNASVGLNWD